MEDRTAIRIMVEPVKLKPCPFCGGEAEFHEARQYSGNQLRYLVRCKDTDCMGRGLKRFKTPEAAIEAWNKREGR